MQFCSKYQNIYKHLVVSIRKMSYCQDHFEVLISNQGQKTLCEAIWMLCCDDDDDDGEVWGRWYE